MTTDTITTSDIDVHVLLSPPLLPPMTLSFRVPQAPTNPSVLDPYERMVEIILAGNGSITLDLSSVTNITFMPDRIVHANLMISRMLWSVAVSEGWRALTTTTDATEENLSST